MGWMRGVLEGLVYLHNRGTAHRDIKLENVALAASGHVKLIDFGYASAWDHLSKYTPGTEEYIGLSIYYKTNIFTPNVQMELIITTLQERKR